MKIKPCKHCGRTGRVVFNTNKVGAQITSEKCQYCNGKGYTIIENEEKPKNKKEDIKNSNI